MLIEVIGMPAMLEQTAEECNELSFACLKLARHLRGENKVHGRTPSRMKADLVEEIADIMVCINELKNSDLINEYELDGMLKIKMERMEKRLREEKDERRGI